MSSAQKFVFGTDFREGGRRGASEADLAAARAEGFQAGQEQCRRETEGQVQAMMMQLSRSADRLIAGEAARTEAVEAKAAHLAMVMARKLARAALAAHPLAQIEAAIRDCLGHARLAPHLVVRCHESAVEGVESLIARLARETGFAGRIVVLGEPDIQPGDGRVEWADGGFSIDGARFEQLVDQAVRSVFSDAAIMEE